MFLSPLFRKAALWSALVSGLCISGAAQAALVTNGVEYVISGKIAGDQVYPQLAINANGGYLVSEDNSVDGSGKGINAQALDSNFHPVGNRFRVNQNIAGDQEHPQVALLQGGGAVFVWQSRPRTSSRHVFARFLTASNSWAGGDVMLNTTTEFQMNPVVATLANGNVVIVYAGAKLQDAGRMQDVYAQIFSPSGQSVSSEFLINQFTDFNQRTPAVAALTGGGFVIAWVSEQQRVANNIDIYARMFAATGTPVGNEFLVNTNATIACANPSVAARADGGFTAVWGERSMQEIGNGWDVFTRTFSAAGIAATEDAKLLNTYQFGDQFGPKLGALANGSMAVWTSLAQDGSGEGVYGRLLDAAGNPQGDEIRVNTTTIGGQKFPSIVSDGNARVLSVWSSFSGITSGFDIYAQLYAAPDYIAAAATTNYLAPSSDPFPTGQQGGDSGQGPVLGGGTSGTNGTTADLTLAVGTYYGEFYDLSNGVGVASAGSFTATVNSRGVFTAKLIAGGKAYSARGQVDSSGNATTTAGKGGAQLKLNLQVDLTGGNQITGTVSGTGWDATLYASRLTFNKTKTSAQAYSGTYTLRIPADTTSANSPGGDGFASVKIDAGGRVQLSGSLADGTKISEKTAISTQGYWPLFVSLYKGQGCLVGWLTVTNNQGMSGQVVWMKSASARGKSYQGGFTNNVEVGGALFQRIIPGKKALAVPGNLQLRLSGGGLSADSVNPVSLDLRNHITGPPNSKLRITINQTTGLFTGSIRNDGKTIKLQGAVSGDDGAYGYFLNNNQSGCISLGGAQ